LRAFLLAGLFFFGRVRDAARTLRLAGITAIARLAADIEGATLACSACG
jgi:hypothetical protein